MTSIDTLRKARLHLLGKRVAILDVAGTIVLGATTGRFIGLPLYLAIPGMFLVGHVVHRVAGIRTQFS